MALKIKHVGQYAPHNVAQQAGFKEGDILVSINGLHNFLRETDLLEYTLNQQKPGDLVEIEFFREGKKESIEMRLPLAD